MSVISVRCEHCKLSFSAQRKDIAYWPDHLWIGAVSAMARCQCGKWAGAGWAHDLPAEWQEDIPRRDWLQYCLPRLIYGCHHYGVPADFLPEFSELPHFGSGVNPVPGQAYDFDVEEGYRKPFSFLSFIKECWRGRSL